MRIAMYKSIRNGTLIMLAGLAALAAVPASRADESLRPKVAEIALDIKKILDGRTPPVDSIAVGEFSAPAGYAANYGPGVADLLTQELTKLKIRVNKDAAYKVQGDFVKAMLKDVNAPGDVMAVKLNFRIYDNTGDELTSVRMNFHIKNNAGVAKALGYTGPLSPKGDYYVRNQDLQRNLGQKSGHFDSTRIVTSSGQFAMEILVRPYADAPAKARQPQFNKDNDVFVGIGRGEIYEIRLYNYSKLDAAVTLEIDGLSVFAFSEVRNEKGGPKYSYYIIPPGQNSIIVGWHKRNEGPKNHLAFLVTAYGEGASRLAPQPTGKIGIITATFAYAWTGKVKPAEEEGTRDGGNETGFGPPRTQELTEAQRHIGVVRDVVSIRYTRP
jgi:hypothetical protein